MRIRARKYCCLMSLIGVMFGSLDSARATDPWPSEELSEKAHAQLEHLADELVDAERNNEQSLLIASQGSVFFPQPSKADRLATVAPFTIRWFADTPKQPSPLSDFAVRLGRLWPESQARKCNFKIVRVRLEDSGLETIARVAISGTGPKGRFECLSRWAIDWRLAENQQLSVERISISEMVLVQREVASGKSLLSDQTAKLFAKTPVFQQQLAVGQPYWLRRIESMHGILNVGQNGLSVADVNGDGRDDLYVCQPGGLPNRLFLQNSQGMLEDASARFGVDLLDNTHSSLWLDLDNDGDQDLVLSTAAALLIFENENNSTCVLKKSWADIPDAYSLAAADYDQDGRLDLFACAYFPSGADVQSLPVPIPYFDAKNGGRNRLLRNLGEWQFEDVTRAVGLESDNHRFSYAAIWVDTDQDGREDLYVANDFGPDNLYRNVGGRFEERSDAAGLVHGAFGMSASVADFDRDGKDDIYVGNMYSSAGNRVTRQSRFRPEANSTQRMRFQRLAAGNSLFRNQGNGRFEEIATDAGVAMGRWSWSSNFMDLNNDGWEDLLVTNGYITGEDPGDL